jgi:hypothetical protein
MISHRYKFIFVHAARTGGSSFERVVGKEITRDDRTKHLGNTDFEDKHFDFEFYKTQYPLEFYPYFKFTIVRNPYDRLVSAWKWRTEIVGDFTGLSLAEYTKARSVASKYSAKFKLEGMTIRESIALFDYTGRFEDIENTYKYLFDKLNISCLEIPHTNKTNRTAYRDYYDHESIELVRHHYQADLDLFNYDF